MIHRNSLSNVAVVVIICQFERRDIYVTTVFSKTGDQGDTYPYIIVCAYFDDGPNRFISLNIVQVNYTKNIKEGKQSR